MKTNVINSLMKRCGELFADERIQNLLYIRNEDEEYFIIECKEWRGNRKTFVLKFECGNLSFINTQYNTMEMYIPLIINSDYSEFIHGYVA